MTISTTIIKNSYSGNGSTTAFTYNFKITDEDDIQVIIRSAAGTETVKTKTTHYTVGGVGNNSGTVTFVTAPTSSETVVLRRSTTQTQAMDLIDNDPMSADTIETAHDKSIAISQELQEQLDRSLKISRANTMTSTEFTTSATDRANKVLAFDSSGELSVTQELGTYKGTDATTTTAAYVQRDIIKSTTAAQLNNVYICTADAVVGDALTDTDHFALLLDAKSAADSATAAASSATAAASSASAASSSATAAASSASTASTQASNASTSASAASSSATAAASSATSAAASYDSFDDRYLGAKSSDPSVDNDGASLIVGCVYFNSSAGNLRIWNGSAWVVISADTDVKVLVSSNDTTAGYLNGKLVAGTGISFTENNNGSDETLTITNTGEEPTALAIALG